DGVGFPIAAVSFRRSIVEALQIHHDFHAERVFVGPVFVDGGFADAGFRGDGVHAGGVDAAVGEQFGGGFEHFLMGALAKSSWHGFAFVLLATKSRSSRSATRRCTAERWLRRSGRWCRREGRSANA